MPYHANETLPQVPVPVRCSTARHLDYDKNDLLNAGRGRGADNVGRMTAMKLCQELSSMKLSAMAELFGVGSDSAISRAISRFNQTLSTDQRLEKMFNHIYLDLPPLIFIRQLWVRVSVDRLHFVVKLLGNLNFLLSNTTANDGINDLPWLHCSTF